MRRRVFVNDGTGAIRNADQIKIKPRELSNKDRSGRRVSQIYELLIRTGCHIWGDNGACQDACSVWTS